MLQVPRNWGNPLGDGKTSSRIVEDMLAHEEEIVDNTFGVPFLDQWKRTCFSPFVSTDTRLEMPPAWSFDQAPEVEA